MHCSIADLFALLIKHALTCNNACHLLLLRQCAAGYAALSSTVSDHHRSIEGEGAMGQSMPRAVVKINILLSSFRRFRYQTSFRFIEYCYNCRHFQVILATEAVKSFKTFYVTGNHRLNEPISAQALYGIGDGLALTNLAILSCRPSFFLRLHIRPQALLLFPSPTNSLLFPPIDPSVRLFIQ